MAFKLTGKQQELLTWARVARVATFGKKRGLHLVPMCYAYDGASIYIGTRSNTRKVKNLKESGRMAFLVDEYSEDWGEIRGLLLHGKSTLHNGGAVFRRARGLLYSKYLQHEAKEPLVEGRDIIIQFRPEGAVAWDYSEL